MGSHLSRSGNGLLDTGHKSRGSCGQGGWTDKDDRRVPRIWRTWRIRQIPPDVTGNDKEGAGKIPDEGMQERSPGILPGNMPEINTASANHLLRLIHHPSPVHHLSPVPCPSPVLWPCPVPGPGFRSLQPQGAPGNLRNAEAVRIGDMHQIQSPGKTGGPGLVPVPDLQEFLDPGGLLPAQPHL